MKERATPPHVGEPFRLPEFQPKQVQLPAPLSRAALTPKTRRRLSVDLQCRQHWQTYRADFRFNARAMQFVMQTARPKIDTDEKPTDRGLYVPNMLRLSDIRCPGCGASVRIAECRFDHGLQCANSRRDVDSCPGWCDRLGLRGRS
ncbi:hypothetical protein BRAS3809_1160001 [Bradyrhizobium sp. STM 3809]|nr:hypothetical protein BRAS3809_1160001 [Bradyrhizobium sp. STM 3809]